MIDKNKQLFMVDTDTIHEEEKTFYRHCTTTPYYNPTLVVRKYDRWDYPNPQYSRSMTNCSHNLDLYLLAETAIMLT